MEKEEMLIMEESPPDTSTYLEGNLGIKEKPLQDEGGVFSFFDAINAVREMNLL